MGLPPAAVRSYAHQLLTSIADRTSTTLCCCACCRNGRMGLPPAAVRSYAHQLLTALAELHDTHAVVHRDVKPSNMLLQQPFVVRTGKVHEAPGAGVL